MRGVRRSDGVFVVGRGQAAEDERNGDHVLDAVVAVGGIGERAFLVDDAEAGLMRADGDSRCSDAFMPSAASCACSVIARFDRGLRVELGRES